MSQSLPQSGGMTHAQLAISKQHKFMIKVDDGVEHPLKYFCLRCYRSGKISEIMFKMYFCNPYTEIPRWNEYKQSVCIID